MQSLGKILMLISGVVFMLGLILHFFGNKLNFIGKLPGDINIQREGFSFYFPITTCILASLLVSAVYKIIQRFW
jgi:hypothetical protein